MAVAQSSAVLTRYLRIALWRKAMYRRISSVLVLVSAATLAVACGGQVDGETRESVEALSDPCTGDDVGYFDREAKTMYLHNGLEISRDQVHRVAPSEAPALQCSLPDDSNVEGARTMSAWANGNCWRFFETYAGGSASCSGCCYPAGGGAYTCWESCYDYMHS